MRRIGMAALAALLITGLLVDGAAARPDTSGTKAARKTVAKYRTAWVKHRAKKRSRARTRTAPGGLGVGPDCLGPAGDAEPGTQAWTERDYANQYCATERLVDEVTSPSFFETFNLYTAQRYPQQNAEMLQQGPQHLHLTLGQLVPGGTTTDPFRTLDRWESDGRGRVDAISFKASDGATLNGYILRPPASVAGPYPGVVITTGSIQGYQEMYLWAAEGLAEAGYQVMTYDVQGQGNSDTLPENCAGPDDCPGVPFQQAYNFFQGAEDSLNFFFSNANPGRAELDTEHVGIAGHSLGASAVSLVGQCDPRVKAIVAWDNLAPANGTCAKGVPDGGFPAGTPENPTLATPALGLNAEYFFNPTSTNTPPDPQSKSAGFKQLSAAGTDTMQVALRSSTHLEWTYVPYILPASRLGERVSFHYTLAWFDRYLRDDATAFHRLTTKRFDDSSDEHSIGAGFYDPEAALADPADTTAGNVPYEIKGLPVADRVSIYYASQYSLSRPGGTTKATCTDMRNDCP